MKSANEPCWLLGAPRPTARANSPAFELTTCVNSAPQAAMPVAIPTWRKVEFTPQAMPARAGGTIPTPAGPRRGDDPDRGGRQSGIAHAHADARERQAGQQGRPVVPDRAAAHQQEP